MNYGVGLRPNEGFINELITASLSPRQQSMKAFWSRAASQYSSAISHEHSVRLLQGIPNSCNISWKNFCTDSWLWQNTGKSTLFSDWRNNWVPSTLPRCETTATVSFPRLAFHTAPHSAAASDPSLQAGCGFLYVTGELARS